MSSGWAGLFSSVTRPPFGIISQPKINRFPTMYLKKILSGNEQAPKPDESGPDQGSDPARKPESQNSHKDQDQSSGEPVGGYRLKGIARPIDDFKDKASNSPGEIEPHQEKENQAPCPTQSWLAQAGRGLGRQGLEPVQFRARLATSSRC